MQENYTNEDLPNFPFKNWSEFKEANANGSASLGIDRSIALSWTQKGAYAPTGLRLYITLLMLLPFLSTLGFIIYVILTKSWFLLPALILFFISIFIFSPSSRFVLGSLPNLIVGMIFAGFVWGIFKDISWLVVLTSCLLLIRYGKTEQYKKSVAGLKKALLTHEDLFILFWNIKGINIVLPDGIYWVDRKLENKKEFEEGKNLVQRETHPFLVVTPRDNKDECYHVFILNSSNTTYPKVRKFTGGYASDADSITETGKAIFNLPTLEPYSFFEVDDIHYTERDFIIWYKFDLTSQDGSVDYLQASVPKIISKDKLTDIDLCNFNRKGWIIELKNRAYSTTVDDLAKATNMESRYVTFDADGKSLEH